MYFCVIRTLVCCLFLLLSYHTPLQFSHCPGNQAIPLLSLHEHTGPVPRLTPPPRYPYFSIPCTSPPPPHSLLQQLGRGLGHRIMAKLTHMHTHAHTLSIAPLFCSDLLWEKKKIISLLISFAQDMNKTINIYSICSPLCIFQTPLSKVTFRYTFYQYMGCNKI